MHGFELDALTPVRAIRRLASEQQISLVKRRAWFTDEPPKGDQQPDADASPDGADDDEDISKLPKWAQRIIKETRDEARDRRLEAKKLKDDQAAAEATRLQEEGKWRELAEKRGKDLEALKPSAERLTALEQKIQATNETRINKIPEPLRSVIPADYDPVKLSEWLDANEGKLTTPPAPQMDGGQRGDGKQMPKLTPDELAMAQKMGLTPEKYLAAKLKN